MVSKTVGHCASLEEARDHEPTRVTTANSAWIANLVAANNLISDKGEPTSTISDDREALVSAAVDGDRPAVEGVLRWIRPHVVRYCRARVGTQEGTVVNADDLAQEVCIAVLRALPNYRDQGRPFLAFVYSIAAHKVSDAYRSAARHPCEPVPEVPDSQDRAEGPEERMLQDEMAGRMAKLLNILPTTQREVLRLRVVLGLSATETAEALGSTPGAVRVAQHRALARLREILAATPRVLRRGAQAEGRRPRGGFPGRRSRPRHKSTHAE